MNRKNIASLVVLDLLVMALAAGLLFIRYDSLQTISRARSNFPVAIPRTSAAPAEVKPVEVSTVSLPNIPVTPIAQAIIDAPKETRHIGFHFRHSKAKRVQIIGDFNEWIPQSMNLGLDYTWSIALDIPPGDYAYNFVIDGKPIRDPNNQKVCDAGRGFPNSYLRVKLLADDTPKKQ